MSARRRTGDIALQVTEAGPEDGPLVILLHGFPDAWWTWERQIGPLAVAGFRVVIPDLRGYNRSDKPPGVAAYTLDKLAADIVGLADAYERRTFRLVGHDWGGVIAYGVGIRHPERVERIVVIAAPHPDSPIRQALRHPSQALRSLYVAFFQLPLIPETLLGARRFALMRRSLTGSSRPGVFSSSDLDRYVDAWAQPGALTAMLNYYRALRHYRRPKSPARLIPPTLIIWGGRDAFLGEHLYRAALDLCDDGEGMYLHKATHWVHREEADLVSNAMIRFFGGTTSSSGRA